MKVLTLFKFGTKKSKQGKEKESLVLIGTVKSQKQFETCISEGFYHVPYHYLVPEIFSSKKQLEQIDFVSIYQSASLFKENVGVRYYGEVRGVSVVKRSEIKEIPKESNSLYVLFKIPQWKILDEPKSFSELGIYPFKIVEFKNFKAACDTAELFMESSEDRELYRMLARMTKDVNFKRFQFSGFDFEDYNDNLVVSKDGECYLQLPMEVIREMPYSGFETVKNAMNDI